MKFLIVLSKENVNGERTKVTSYLLGVHKKSMKDLLELAKTEYPDCYYIEDDGTIFDALIQDKAYKDGKVVDLTPIPPTESEIKVQSVEEIKNKYNVLDEALKDKILTATLTGNQAVIEKLQNEYKQNMLNMAKELKAVKG
ncbi:hypothetical protein [Veillonella ratti]|uniref:hypothetical protein n=1 Tax=Veillonella ratti TaxID=103892 RepID=UPI000F8C6D91|nr:hypothetical protein [Veillonella ratti]